MKTVYVTLPLRKKSNHDSQSLVTSDQLLHALSSPCDDQRRHNSDPDKNHSNNIITPMHVSKESSSHLRKQQHGQQQGKLMRVVDDLDDGHDDEVEDIDVDALTYYPAEVSTFDPGPTPSLMMSLDSTAFNSSSPTVMEIVSEPGSRGEGIPRKKRAASSSTKPTQAKKKYRRRQQQQDKHQLNKSAIGFIMFPPALKLAASRTGGEAVDVNRSREPTEDAEFDSALQLSRNGKENQKVKDEATVTSIPLKKRLLHCVHPIPHAQVQV